MAALALIFGATFFLLATRQNVEAKTVNVKLSQSGSSVNVVLSFDGLDVANQFIMGGRMEPGGAYTADDIIQTKPNGNSCTVPGGVADAGSEGILVGSNSVWRFQPSGDLLYSHATAVTACQDLSSGSPPFPFVATNVLAFTGGTGKYAGATGTLTLKIAGVILSLLGGVSGTGPGFGGFVSAHATGTGTLTTP
jgi:hypothetical protein